MDLIISIIIGFIFFLFWDIMRYEQRRKKSVNELDDDFEYKLKEEKVQKPENTINN